MKGKLLLLLPVLVFAPFGPQAGGFAATDTNTARNESLPGGDSLSYALLHKSAELNYEGTNSPTSAANSPGNDFVYDREKLLARVKLAEAGDLDAEFEIGVRYATVDDLDVDPSLAVKSLKIAATRGNVPAQRRLGIMLADGIGCQTNIQESVMWLTKAATADDALAQFALGTKYMDGVCLPKDRAKAFHWLLLAAQQGHSDAQNQVGLMYLTGDGTDQNPQLGREWLEKAVKQNNAGALSNLGRVYFEGISVERDVVRGESLLVRSAMLGNMVAEANLGAAYVLGNGVKKNTAFGRRLLKNAAELGNLTAQVNYGNFLMNDEPPDYKTAFDWISNAARQDFPEAEFEAGMMYKAGLGVESNGVNAFFWFELAGKNGIEKAIVQKNILQASLNADQIKEADEKASSFQIQKGNHILNMDSENFSARLNDDGTIFVRMFGSTNNFAFDTGAEIGCIDDSFRPRLDAMVASVKLYGAYTSSENVPIFPCPDILIENKPLNISWVACQSLQELSKLNTKTVDGILGMDFLKKGVIYFNKERGMIFFGNSVPEAIRQTTEPVRIETVPGHDAFCVKVQINGRALNLLIDSGDSGEINFDDQDSREIFGDKKTQTTGSTFAGLGDQQGRNGFLFNLQKVSIGTNCFSNLAATSVQGRSYSSIGRPFILKHFAALDFPNKLIYVLSEK